MINPESNLKSEYENANVVDYRDPLNPNNNVVITCEHASNELPDDYAWTDKDRRNFTNEHWAIDIGAFKIAQALAQELKCVFVHALYSRLLLDVNRTLVADTLFRKDGDGQEVDLNKDMTYEEEQRRIRRFYMPYYEALREVSNKVNPTYVLSIHSFTPLYEGQTRSTEIGVLYSHESTEFALKLNQGMDDKGYYSEVNKPYDGLTSLGALKSVLYSSNSVERRGVTFEFRNDILLDEKKYPELKSATVEVVKNVCQCD